MRDISFQYKDSLISWDRMKDAAESLTLYTRHLVDVARNGGGGERYEDPESSINLPADRENLEMVEAAVLRTRTKSLKYIIVVGIGGSNLGARAIIDGLRGVLDPFLGATAERPKIIFADTVSPKLLDGIREIIKENIEAPKEVLVNIISKSGSTTETIADFEIIHSILRERFNGDEKIKKSIVVTTDYGSKLWTLAEEGGYEKLAVPKNVGGRYSVFSAVGLYPLALIGANVKDVLDGALAMRERCVKKELEENPALASAVLMHLHNKDGAAISNTFFFNPHLGSVGMWYRQLLGESIGKKYAIDGSVVNAGVTPVVSIGSTDLHSMAQLYLGGPKDKFTTFVYAPREDGDMTVPKDLVFPGLVDGIGGKKISDVMGAILEGVKEAYKKDGMPFMEATLHDTNEYSLGQFLQWKMMEMMYLARLFGVNAFDQPNVEDYKRETRRILLEGR